MQLKLLGTLALPLTLAACAYPVTTAEQGAAASGLYFVGAPPNARVLIDAADAGVANIYDGKKAILVVEPGRRHVVVSVDSNPVYDKIMYVGTGSRIKIEVR